MKTSTFLFLFCIISCILLLGGCTGKEASEKESNTAPTPTTISDKNEPEKISSASTIWTETVEKKLNEGQASKSPISVTDEGFTANYKDYKFKLDRFIHDSDLKISGAVIDVRKPDGTVVQAQCSRMANAIVDDLEISIDLDSYVDSENLRKADIFVMEKGN